MKCIHGRYDTEWKCLTPDKEWGAIEHERRPSFDVDKVAEEIAEHFAGRGYATRLCDLDGHIRAILNRAINGEGK
jgi:hypothetical protein